MSAVSESGDATGHRGDGVRAVERAIDILKTFTVDQPEQGVSEISHRLDIHKSTVSRILATLERGGLVERDQASRAYRLGTGILILAGNTLAHLDLRRAATDVVHGLADACGETVDVSVLEDGRTVSIEAALSRSSLRATIWLGKYNPPHCQAVGKVLLAHAPDEVVDRILSGPLEQLTEHTITDEGVLRQILEKVRQTGMATAFEEMEYGLNALAVPVYDNRGEVIAALSISGPSSRLPKERLDTLLGPAQEAAARISRRMGCLTEHPDLN